MFKDLVLSDVEMDIQIKPEIVFEIGYEEIQRSSNYKSGFALRFPRLVRVREDKSVKDADTIERVRELYKKQKGQT